MKKYEKIKHGHLINILKGVEEKNKVCVFLFNNLMNYQIRKKKGFKKFFKIFVYNLKIVLKVTCLGLLWIISSLLFTLSFLSVFSLTPCELSASLPPSSLLLKVSLNPRKANYWRCVMRAWGLLAILSKWFHLQNTFS